MKLFKFSKLNISIRIVLGLISLYLFTTLERVKTKPLTCGIKYPIHFHFNCSLQLFLMWSSVIILILSIVYLIILAVLYLIKK